MKAVIIDDEYLAREIISNLIAHHHPEILVVASCADGPSGRDAILSHRPDLIFLDIQMPVMNGFEVLDSLRDVEIDAKVIFTTAHDDYTIKAIRYAAFDYLLKPIDTEEFIQCMSRLSQGRVEKDQINLLQQHRKNTDHYNQIVISHSKGLSFLTVDDIIIMKSENNYTHIYSQGRKPILASTTLGHYVNLLSDRSDFMRVHKQYLINTTHIKEYKGGDDNLIVLTDNHIARLARSQRKKFLSTFRNL